MDYNLQKERSRINKILNKHSANYISPVSLANQPLNRLTKHKKFYNNRGESSELDSDFSSISFFLKYNQKNSGKLASLSESSKYLNQSAQHLFTFQTLREAIASDHQGLKAGPIGQSKIQLKEKLKKYINLNNDSDYNKLLKYLPSLKKSQFNQKKSSFLNEGFKSNQRKVSRIKFSDGAIENLKIETEKNGLKAEDEGFLKIKPEEIFKNEMILNSQSKNMGTISERPRKIPKVPSEYSRNKSKLITVKLPKALKSRYFADAGNNSVVLCKDDDLLIQGWEELGPLDI